MNFLADILVNRIDWEGGLRDNLPANANRFLLGVVEMFVGGVNDLSMNLVCPSTIVSENIGCNLNVTLGHIDALSVIQSLY